MIYLVRSAFLFLLLVFGLGTGLAQPIADKRPGDPAAVDKPPYKLMTSGNLVSISCSKDIISVMAWTSTGNRIFEKKVLAPSCSFRVPVSHKLVFVRIELAGGKTYSEKIGIQ